MFQRFRKKDPTSLPNLWLQRHRSIISGHGQFTLTEGIFECIAKEYAHTGTNLWGRFLPPDSTL